MYRAGHCAISPSHDSHPPLAAIKNLTKMLMRSTSRLLLLALAASHLLLTAAGAGCGPSGTLRPTQSHSCQDCCKAGQAYPTYRCSPPVSSSTRAVMTLNDFDAGGDGGDPSECDGAFHRSSERVVALSTGWYSGGSRCGKSIRIRANGGSVLAKVVDECDTVNGCDREHAFQPPCRNNVVDASQAVWDALGITGEEVGEYNITWSDA